MGLDYNGDIEPINVQAHGGSLEVDVDAFKDNDTEDYHVTAFEIVYGISVEKASGLL